MSNILNLVNDLDGSEIAHASMVNAQDLYKLLNLSEKDFTLVSQNIRSVYQNFDDFLVNLTQLNFRPDLIILTECWLSKHKPIPSLPNYLSFNSTRFYNKSDGVIVYIRDDISGSVKEIDIEDATCLQIETPNCTTLAIHKCRRFY